MKQKKKRRNIIMIVEFKKNIKGKDQIIPKMKTKLQSPRNNTFK